MSAGAAFKPPSMHLRRVRDLLTQEGVTTDLASVIDELRGRKGGVDACVVVVQAEERRLPGDGRAFEYD